MKAQIIQYCAIFHDAMLNVGVEQKIKDVV